MKISNSILSILYLLNSSVPIILGKDISSDSFDVINLTVNRLNKPLGLDEKTPYFGWQMKTDRPENKTQVSYKIVVKNEEGKTMWNSGKVKSDQSQNVQYNGKKLSQETYYSWSVEISDNNGKTEKSSSYFTTGLNLSREGQGNWEGAEWIGSNDLPLNSHTLAVYTIKTSIRISAESDHAGIVFGANDARLMSADKNIWHLEASKNESRIEYVLDISAFPAKLKIYRHGYSANDTKKPVAEFEITEKTINSKNAHDFHEIWIFSSHGVVQLGIDEEVIDLPQINYVSKGAVINPAGPGGDYMSFPMVADIGFVVDAGQKAEFKNYKVLNYRSPGNALFSEDLTEEKNSIFTGQQGITISNGVYQLDGGVKGALVVANPSRGSMPALQTSFKIKNKQISHAFLYATARGIYELTLNNKKVSNDYFAPGFTQYDRFHLYQTYDVTKQIRKGNNTLMTQLAEGWWSGAITFTGDLWNYFGDRQSFIAKLVITYKDGSRDVIKTNSKTWKLSTDGPLISSSFFQGENYDARRELKFNKNAEVIPINEETTHLEPLFNVMSGDLMEFDYSKVKFVGQETIPVRDVEQVKAKSVKKLKDKIYIYDMGANLAGVPKITIPNGKAGNKVTLRFAEVLYPENDVNNAGELMLENIRAALATDTYILKGGKEIISPRFTYHGYRYIEITGLDKLSLKNVETIVLSSIDRFTAGYKCSNESINKLFQNILRTTHANFLAIPTDCPQRNERMGWSGDLSVFSKTASYLWDVNNFLSQHLQAMRDTQTPKGRFDDIAPLGGGFGGPLWGSAGIIVAKEVYQQYGDENIYQQHYQAMKKYMDYLETKVLEDGILTEGAGAELGDWLGPENSKNDVSFLVFAQEIKNLKVIYTTAEHLGKTDDAEYYKNLYNKRKALFNKKFVDASTHKTLKSNGELMDTQTSYATGLEYDAFNDENSVYAAKYLVEACERENVDDEGITRPPYSLMTGFVGTALISKALTHVGRSDVAYKLIENHQYPSWLYSVDQGATTIWERLNSYTKENGFGGNNSMNSFNHYSFGSVGAWMIEDSLGIQRDEQNPGWKQFNLRPQPDFNGKMTWAKGHYDSQYGKIESYWKLSKKECTYKFTIPVNTKANCQLNVPKSFNSTTIKINGKSKNVTVKNHKVNLELLPGKWNIIVKN
ncbi:alpha-L-rhamnosidase N-terminal domain protein [Neocallimastix lanati (nom. inval.)]|jgi:alpha-L-rhamnosidase|nr:alpha-L-rhamnosidase N-terminal domain protein [Neocallimastix sp. JGI-2020a]